jgi:hypothetical protein
MAEDLSEPNPAGQPEGAAQPAERGSRKSRLLVTPFRRKQDTPRTSSRFMLAYLLLGAILGGAAVGFALMMTTADGGDDGGSHGWSAWRPTAEGEAGVDQIASFVGGRYRLPSGKQLVAVLANEPSVQDQVPVSNVAIEEPTRDAAGEPNYTIHETGGDYMYVLCGLGQNCAIREGPPSVERHRLLRREALELALYTFRYVDGVDSIIAFLPPRPGQQPTSLLYFRKSDFDEHLSRPLRETLPGEKPPKMDQMPAREQRTVDQLTTKNLFRYEFQQAPDASAILVLTPQFPSN